MSEIKLKKTDQPQTTFTINPAPKPEIDITVIETAVRVKGDDQVFFFRFGGENPDPEQLSKVRVLTTIHEHYYQGTASEFHQQQRDATYKKVSRNGMEIWMPTERNIEHIQLLSAEMRGTRVPLCGHARLRREESCLEIAEIMSVYNTTDRTFQIFPLLKTTTPSAFVKLEGLHALTYQRDGTVGRLSMRCSELITSQGPRYNANNEPFLIGEDTKHLQITHALTNFGELPLSALVSRVPIKKYGMPFIFYKYPPSSATNG